MNSRFTYFYFTYLLTPENVVLRHQVNFFDVATHHKYAFTARKCRAAVRHSLACGGPLLGGPCSARPAEHA